MRIFSVLKIIIVVKGLIILMQFMHLQQFVYHGNPLGVKGYAAGKSAFTFNSNCQDSGNTANIEPH